MLQNETNSMEFRAKWHILRLYTSCLDEERAIMGATGAIPMCESATCEHSDQGKKFKVVGGENEIYIITYCTQCGQTIGEVLDASAVRSPWPIHK
jgi:tetrahydromethanopterin S-methyltransferase subunit A